MTGNDLVVSWGKIGTAGQSQTKSFATPAAAAAELTKLMAEKVKKGYGEVAAGAAPVVPGTGAGPHLVSNTAVGGQTLRPETRARILALLDTPPAPTAPITTNAPTISPIAARAGSLQKWSALDDDGKAEALEGNRDVLGASLSEDVDVGKLTPAQRVIVDKIITLAEAELAENDEGGDTTCQIGDPEPSVNIMVDVGGEVLGVAVRFHQAGGALPDRDDNDGDDDDDDDDGLSGYYPDEASAKKAGVDTGADVSWSTSEAMVFEASGRPLRDPGGAYWEWTGW